MVLSPFDPRGKMKLLVQLQARCDMTQKRLWTKLRKQALIVLLSVSGCTAVAFAIEPVLQDKTPFLPLTIAVILSSWYGGLTAGLTSTLLGFVIANYFFLRPRYHLLPIDTRDFALFAVFL